MYKFAIIGKTWTFSLEEVCNRTLTRSKGCVKTTAALDAKPPKYHRGSLSEDDIYVYNYFDVLFNSIIVFKHILLPVLRYLFLFSFIISFKFFFTGLLLFFLFLLFSVFFFVCIYFFLFYTFFFLFHSILSLSASFI